MHEEPPEIVRFAGEITRISDRFWGEGWGYGTIQTAERDINIAGTLEGVTVGMKVLITGRWEDSKWGARVKIATLVPDLPGSESGIEAWLIHRLPQIGPIRAQDIAHRFGEGLWDVLEKEWERLTEVSGITLERAEVIYKAFLEFRDERKALVEFFSLGLTKYEARRIIRKLGKESHERVAQNPFLLYLEVGGFSFNRTDHIAESLRLTGTFGPRMVSAVIEAARREAAQSGDTVFSEEELVHGAGDVVDDQTLREHLRAALSQALADERLTRFGENFMLTSHAVAEATIAAQILRLTGDYHEEE